MLHLIKIFLIVFYYYILLIIYFVKTETNYLKYVSSVIIFDLYIQVIFAIVY